MRRFHRNQPELYPPRDRRGTATVEFALTAPIFLVILLGIVEMSRALDVSQRLHLAVREGARAAASDMRDRLPPGTTLNQKVINDVRNMLVAGGINPNDLTITITHAEGDKDGQPFDLSKPENSLGYFRVTASVDYGKVGLIPAKTLEGKTIKASAVFRSGRSVLSN